MRCDINNPDRYKMNSANFAGRGFSEVRLGPEPGELLRV